ncbi:MAG TPA: rod shape-determining protein MreC, partial [Chthoniobacterales bacterium]
DLESENNRLRDSLGYLERSQFRLVPAQVVSRDASTWWNTVRINRGFEDGVEVDRPVITDLGLVGKTVSVSKNLSTVVLISDENCKVGARVEGTREQGITQGRRISAESKGEIELNFLTKQADLKPGSVVVSAGVTGGVFPAGLKLGAIKSFRVRDLDGQAVVEPAVDLSTVRDVFVIVSEK